MLCLAPWFYKGWAQTASRNGFGLDANRSDALFVLAVANRFLTIQFISLCIS